MEATKKQANRTNRRLYAADAVFGHRTSPSGRLRLSGADVTRAEGEEIAPAGRRVDAPFRGTTTVAWALQAVTAAAAIYASEPRLAPFGAAALAAWSGSVWAAGLLMLQRGLPRGLAFARSLSTIGAVVSAVLARALPPSPWLVHSVACVLCWASTLLPGTRWKYAAAGAAEGELRIPLAVSFGLQAAVALPSAAVVALFAGLPLIVLTSALPLSIALSGAAFGALLAWPFLVSTVRLEERWLVIAPRGLVIHDPFLLSMPLRIPQSKVSHLITADTGWLAALDPSTRAKLCDLRAGAVRKPLLLYLTEELEAPQPRHPRIRAAFPRSGRVRVVALVPSDTKRAFFALARSGYAETGTWTAMQRTTLAPRTSRRRTTKRRGDERAGERTPAGGEGPGGPSVEGSDDRTAIRGTTAPPDDTGDGRKKE